MKAGEVWADDRGLTVLALEADDGLKRARFLVLDNGDAPMWAPGEVERLSVVTVESLMRRVAP